VLCSACDIPKKKKKLFPYLKSFFLINKNFIEKGKDPYKYTGSEPEWKNNKNSKNNKSTKTND
jgi:hypothetical protein